MDLELKYQELQNILRGYGSAAVAFSSGVDSTFLLKVAADTLGRDKILAVTAQSCSFPQRELIEAAEFCAAEGIEQVICDSEELEIEGFKHNPKNRCYLCKHELFEKIVGIARERGLAVVCDGSNTDDEGDYRPGLQAIKELGVVSPLRMAGLNKDEIRELSRRLGLPTAEKQSFACLASRFPYGELISIEKLSMVDKAEQLLLDLGYRQIRVRIHEIGGGVGGEKLYLARIETLPEEIERLALRDREHIEKYFKELGFTYVSLDLSGYRTGSMNAGI